MHGDVDAVVRTGPVGRSCDYRAHHLVAKHHGFAQDRFAGSTVGPVVQVGAADTAIGNFDDSLVHLRCGHVDAFNPEVTGAMHDDGGRR